MLTSDLFRMCVHMHIDSGRGRWRSGGEEEEKGGGREKGKVENMKI